ncbi:hypothetical protein BKA80DRAFT_261514 [Phyllosticta citrichinensis]
MCMKLHVLRQRGTTGDSSLQATLLSLVAKRATLCTLHLAMLFPHPIVRVPASASCEPAPRPTSVAAARLKHHVSARPGRLRHSLPMPVCAKRIPPPARLTALSCGKQGSGQSRARCSCGGWLWNNNRMLDVRSWANGTRGTRPCGGH